MENINTIKGVKELILTSPVRSKLGEHYNIPFKDIISQNLNQVMENIEIIENKEHVPLKLAIVGEVKAGKSSLLNALISEEVSEVDVLESTSSIIEVVYDKKKYTKTSNGVTRVGLDLEYLKKINIVDTPGLRSITIKNEQKTLGYIQNADLILFVIDATHIGQEDVGEALELLSSYNKQIVGVINKSDLLRDDKDKVMDYIKDEYDLYIDDFFMVSSYLEYQEQVSKNAKVGRTDLVISGDTNLKANFIKLIAYIDNVYKNCDELKRKSIKSSVKGIIHNDIIHHHEYIKSISMVADELKKHERLLENKMDYIGSKMDFEINDWVNRSFLENETSKIRDDIENVNVYINENYINDVVNKKKIELDRLFFDEWNECLQEVNKEIDSNIKKYMDNVNYKNELINTPNFKIDYEKVNFNDMLATVGTGAILGATSGTVVSVYVAGLGTSATSVTIGTALMTYCPPLLIAGTITGAIGKLIYDKMKNDKRSRDILKDIDDFKEELKYSILGSLKDGYNNSSKEIINTTVEVYKNSKGIFMNRYQIENFLEELDLYIKKCKDHIKN